MSKKKIPDDCYLYCKAFNAHSYSWAAYNSDWKQVSSGVGDGEYESAIDCAYQAIISGMDAIKVPANNRRVRVLNDIQFVIDQLSYNGPLLAEHLIIKYRRIQSIKKCFSHVRWSWAARDEILAYIADRRAEGKHAIARIESNTEKKRVDYYEYIRSEKWKSKAELCKRLAGWRCQVCNRSLDDVPLNAHHRTYANLGHEEQCDLVCLCKDCHELFEKNSSHRPASKKRVKPGTVQRLTP
jgi:hypothetical protein